jgi:hypothetical protein
MLDFLLGILSAGFGDNSLDTRKIDRNIEMLKPNMNKSVPF